ncbi:MAG: cobalt ECF transporter T component CbiQ [Treponema sp.]|jgi:cobalt/nickel transport system permease protein|nr:cobalt ECF transporter T component CbiQ [Treponema sp.]
MYQTEELYTLERLSAGNSVVHRLHPAVKIAAAVIFLISVVSFDRYALRPLLPFLFYPSVLIALGELPPALLFRRAALALPFCLFTGISNCVFERETAFHLGFLGVSFGFISLCTLLLRALLCASGVLILIATTPWPHLSAQFRGLHVSGVFMTVLEMAYRYIAVLLAEVRSMYTAYRLRSREAKGIAAAHAGSFVGSLFLRSADRAERIYAAMKCRGYDPEFSRTIKSPALKPADFLFAALVSLGCILFRFLDLPALLGLLVSRVLP